MFIPRVDNNLHKVDITNKEEIRNAICDFRPSFVIHSAAQRFPDKVDSDPEAAHTLNVEATRYIVDAAGKLNFFRFLPSISDLYRVIF